MIGRPTVMMPLVKLAMKPTKDGVKIVRKVRRVVGLGVDDGGDGDDSVSSMPWLMDGVSSDVPGVYGIDAGLGLW